MLTKFLVDVIQVVYNKILWLKGKKNIFFRIFTRRSRNGSIGVFLKEKHSGPLGVNESLNLAFSISLLLWLKLVWIFH